jgi:hypothetical protein
MDTRSLVNLDISEDAQVVSELENHGIALQVALWMVTSEYEDGRLVLASEQLPLGGIRESYHKVVTILRETFVRALPSIMIMRPDDPFILDLRKRYSKTPQMSGMRIGGGSIGGRLVEDGYVYKIA